MTPRKGDPDRLKDADVEIGAAVKAKKLRFKRRPETKVDLRGEVRERDRPLPVEKASGSERHNLPEEVEPGVTYSDVGVRWRAAAKLKDPEQSRSDQD
jgi:hypothetical protein